MLVWASSNRFNTSYTQNAVAAKIARRDKRPPVTDLNASVLLYLRVIGDADKSKNFRKFFILDAI